MHDLFVLTFAALYLAFAAGWKSTSSTTSLSWSTMGPRAPVRSPTRRKGALKAPHPVGTSILRPDHGCVQDMSENAFAILIRVISVIIACRTVSRVLRPRVQDQVQASATAESSPLV